MTLRARRVHRVRLAVAACAGTLLGATGLLGAMPAAAAAAGPSIDVSPSNGVVDGQTVSVALHGLGPQAPGLFVSVTITQCGNANSAGVPLDSVTSLLRLISR